MKNQAPAKVVGFQDEALRRMARKAGVSAIAKSGKHMAKVDDQLRAIADSILDAACGRIHILCDYYKSKTVTTAILQTALEEHVPEETFAAPPSRHDRKRGHALITPDVATSPARS